ncbi:TPA: hypothetical protein SHD90_000329 [Campylobacter coli]|nr:hypothetical protein [Campylobacter coli]HEH4508816.1 hypothetical protein [Campylobacter coli]HEH5540464.1 hypothetical protein [Campylobacter coli]
MLITHRKFVFFSLLIPLPFILILLILLYMRDPFWFYHKPYFREESFMKDMRMQARGIILYKNFDSAIIGTSMLENTSAKEANDKLGSKWVNLSLGGSSFALRSIILDYLFKHKNIKNIIYSLDIRSLNNLEKPKDKNFLALYNDNVIKLFKIYLSSRFIGCALTFSKKEKCIGKNNLDTLTNWWTQEQKHFGDFKKWNKEWWQDNFFQNEILQAEDFKPNFNIDISDFKSYVEKYILTHVKKNYNTQFYFIVPSYSRLNYRKLSYGEYYNKDSELFSKYYAILSWFIKETKKYPNVKIYGFDDLDYADNIANYKDPAHYNIDMNSMQLDAIKNNTHILTPQNMGEYFNTVEKKIRDYDLTPFINYIKKIKQE